MPSRSNVHFQFLAFGHWRSALSARVPEYQKLKMYVRPGWQSVTFDSLPFKGLKGHCTDAAKVVALCVPNGAVAMGLTMFKSCYKCHCFIDPDGQKLTR